MLFFELRTFFFSQNGIFFVGHNLGDFPTHPSTSHMIIGTLKYMSCDKYNTLLATM